MADNEPKSNQENTAREALEEGFEPYSPPVISPQKAMLMKRGRLSFVGTVYHQLPNSQPSSSPINFSRWLNSDDTPFGPRKITVTEQWSKIDIAAGWIKQCGFLIISNLEGRHLSRILTKEQREDINSKVIEVCLAPPPLSSYGPRDMHSPPVPKFSPIAYFLIPPGEDLPVTPVDISLLLLKCRKGEADCNLTFFPG